MIPRLISTAFAVVFCFVATAQSSVFEIKGKIMTSKDDLPAVQLLVINSEKLDTNLVELDKGKFEFHLGLNNQYLLIARRAGEPVKKIVVSTSAPMGSSAYKMKLTLDLREEATKVGLAEYNGFEGRFVLKNMKVTELKRRKHEFLPFYDYLLAEFPGVRKD